MKLGILHPVSGALSYSGQQGRARRDDRDRGDQRGRRHQGARRRQDRAAARRCAIHAGGRQCRSREDERGRRGGDRRRLRERICLATTQTAARYDLPYIVDVGVADQIVTRGLKNTFRFGPGFGVIAKTAIDNLVTHQRPGRQARQDGDDRARGLGVRLRPRQAAERRSCPDAASRCWRRSRTRRRRATSTTSCPRSSAQNPDIVIPANYYNEYVLLARTMQQQRCARRASIRCSAARPRPTSSSRNSPRPRSTSWTAITGSTRRTRRRSS